MMVEVFCGILAGAQYSNKIRTWKVTDRIANLVRVASSRFLQQDLWLRVDWGRVETLVLCTHVLNQRNIKDFTLGQ